MQDSERTTKLRVYQRAWYLKNKIRIRLRNREWRLRNPEKVKAYSAKWCKAHPEQRAQIARNHRLKNQARYNANSAAWRKRNPERHAANELRYRRSHAKQIAARVAIWRKRNPVKIHDYHFTRRHRKRNATPDKNASKSINAWTKRILAQPSAKCYYCGMAVSGSAIEFDHIHPISKGGPHAIGNMCVSCKPCNNNKRARLISVWAKRGQQVLSL